MGRRRTVDVLPSPLMRLLSRYQDHPLVGPVRVVFRMGWLFYRNLQKDKAFVQAAGMAYATLMGMVPLLVLVFGLLGTLGILQDPGQQEAVYDALFGALFGDVVEIRNALQPFLEAIDFRALGLASTVVLLVVAARLFLMVERAYSDIFQVRVDRNLGRRILNFYFAITGVPIVMVLSIEGAWSFGMPELQKSFVAVLQFVLLLGALKFFPCTKVRWAPALVGAASSWGLLQLGGWGFTRYIAWSYADPDYALRAFYGSLILVPIFLLWLYVFWIIVLLGVEIAHVMQNYTSLLDAELEARARDRGLRAPSVANAFELLAVVARRFESGEGPSALDDLLGDVQLSGFDIREVADTLVEAGFLLTTDEGWVLGRPANQIALQEVADRWRELTGLGGRESILEDVHSRSHPGTLQDGLSRWYAP